MIEKLMLLLANSARKTQEISLASNISLLTEVEYENSRNLAFEIERLVAKEKEAQDVKNRSDDKLYMYARNELKLADLFGEDSDYHGMLANSVLTLIKDFSDQGHSEYSASQIIRIFSRVAAYNPLTPLEGTDDEWSDVGSGMYQNKRCSHVFKDETGAWDSTGIIFREPDGSCFQNSDSRVYITFPYAPTVEFVDVDENGKSIAKDQEAVQ